MSSARSIVGVKKMGELDKKAFLASCKEKTADELSLSILCSKWEDEIRQPEWHPFKVIDVGGQAKVLHSSRLDTVSFSLFV
jgi:hypothetical protein